MEFNPKVSIVIPVYNGSNYMREAIDSALAQTYQNIEIIVVNDGSDDDGKTEEIAKSYGDKIRYFYKENGGVASALNLGIREMTGEWFAWLSHDDKFSENRLEEDLNVVRREPDTKVTFCKVAIIDDIGNLIECIEYLIKEVITPWDVMTLNGIHMCCMTIHKSCFEKSGIFNESNKTMQDVEMNLALSKYYPFLFNGNALTYVRKHPCSGTEKMKEQHKYDSLSMADFIYKNFTFLDFFPNLDKRNNVQVANAWQKLGDLYNFLGNYEYADECYKKGYTINNKMLSFIGIKYLIGAKKLNSILFDKIRRFRSVINKLKINI